MPARTDRATLPATDISEEWLLRRYLRQRDLAARERLVRSLVPLAQGVAAGYRHPRFEQDLTQAALLGLTKAIDRWDESRGLPLRAYAIPTMHGEVRRWLRDHAWAVHVPRPLQEHVLAVSRTVDALQTGSRRPPTVTEVAAELGIDEEAVLEAMQAGRAYAALALDVPLGDADGGTLLDVIGSDDDRFERVEDVMTLRSMWCVLDDRDRRMLRLRFFEELSQSQIGDLMGCSQMHVSCRLRIILDRLRGVALSPPQRCAELDSAASDVDPAACPS